MIGVWEDAGTMSVTRLDGKMNDLRVRSRPLLVTRSERKVVTVLEVIFVELTVVTFEEPYMTPSLRGILGTCPTGNAVVYGWQWREQTVRTVITDRLDA